MDFSFENISEIDLDAPRAFERIRWRSRRGLLELDLILTRFLPSWDQLTRVDQQAYVDLLSIPDNDFLDYACGHTLPPAKWIGIINAIRAA